MAWEEGIKAHITIVARPSLGPTTGFGNLEFWCSPFEVPLKIIRVVFESNGEVP